MPDPHSTFNEMVTMTNRHHSESTADNLSEHHPVWLLMNEKGRIELVDGGYELVEDIEYPGSGNFQWYSSYGRIQVNPPKFITAAKFDWKQSAMVVTASGREIRQNSGREAMKKLVRSRTAAARKDWANNMSVSMHSDGTGSGGLELGGFQLLITSDGTGTIGGIVSGTHTWWKNQFKQDSTYTAATIRASMQDLWLSCVRLKDKPDIIALDQNGYGFYWDALSDQQRFMDPKLAQAGFEALRFNTAAVYYESSDAGMPANTGYFLNLNYLKLKVHRAAQLSELGERQPVQQDAVVRPFAWMGALCVSNRSMQGKLFKT